MLCKTCGYSMTPFEADCPRCSDAAKQSAAQPGVVHHYPPATEANSSIEPIPVPQPQPHSGINITPTQAVAVALTILVLVLSLLYAFGTTPFLSGVSNVNVQEFQAKVRLGMNQSQVEQALGKPSSTQQLNSGLGQQDFWYYEGSGGMLQITFMNGTVDAINRY